MSASKSNSTPVSGKKQKQTSKNKAAGPKKKVQLADIGGYSHEIQVLRELIETPFKHKELIKELGLTWPRGVLLHGPPGTGKTLLAKALISESGVNCFSISTLDALNTPALNGGGDVEPHLVKVFEEAKENAPSILLIDDLETICPKYESGHMTLQESKAVGTLVKLIDSLDELETPVLILATCGRLDLIHHMLRRPGRLDKEIEIPVPLSSDRTEILATLIKTKKHSLSDTQIANIADRLHGFVGADIAALCNDAGRLTIRRVLQDKENDKEHMVLYQDFIDALPLVKPSALREVQIEVPKVYWKDIGGQEDTKQHLRQSVDWPLKHPEKFDKFGIPPPRGILLFGPPGCSKTLIARALATEYGLNFLAIKGPELFSKWVGESERTLRDMFNRARKSAPSIIFIDEIDALATARGTAKTGTSVGDRVLATFLNEMDGIQNLQNVIVVGATNRPDVIDKALLRQGRLGRIIYVPLPDASTREDIFNIRFRDMPTAEDVKIDELVTRTPGFSGAEVTALCQEAALAALEEDLESEKVFMKHFETALGSVKPRTTAETVAFYHDFYEKNALYCAGCS